MDAEYWRRKAEEAKEAVRTSQREYRDTLLHIAQLYEKIASQEEGREGKALRSK
jgi:hypothetical protein